MAADVQTSTAAEALRLAGSALLFVRALEQHLRAHGDEPPLTLIEMGVLGQIERGIDLPSLVARTLRLDPARVTHIIDRMVRDSLVERSLDVQDRRRWRLALTAEGVMRLSTGRDSLLATLDALLANLSLAERAGLAEGLEAVRRELSTFP